MDILDDSLIGNLSSELIESKIAKLAFSDTKQVQSFRDKVSSN